MFSLQLTVAVTLAPPSDPRCDNGIRSSDVCCAKSCGRCGGESCQDRHGGEHACCTSAIEHDGRSCNTTVAPCVISLPPLPPAPPPSVRVNPKRGFVADGGWCDDALLLHTSGWFYGYNVYDPYRDPKAHGNCSRASAEGHLDRRFTPMNWCLSSLDHKIPPYVNRTFFMGFNEPNNRHNCNTEPSKVAAAWAQVERQWPDSKLVSPATSGDGVPWFDQFFGNCTLLYGKKGCRIDYLAAHDYSCTPNSTLSYLELLYKRQSPPPPPTLPQGSPAHPACKATGTKCGSPSSHAATMLMANPLRTTCATCMRCCRCSIEHLSWPAIRGCPPGTVRTCAGWPKRALTASRDSPSWASGTTAEAEVRGIQHHATATAAGGGHGGPEARATAARPVVVGSN